MANFEYDEDARKRLPPKGNIYDWQSSMRNEFQEIFPGLYFGSHASVMKSQLERLKAEGITHIILVRHANDWKGLKPRIPDDFTYLVIDMQNDLIIPHLPKTETFIHDAIRSGGRVLVYGLTGMDLSAAFVTAFVMDKYKVSSRKASRYVSSKRPVVVISKHYQQQLDNYCYESRILGEAAFAFRDRWSFHMNVPTFAAMEDEYVSSSSSQRSLLQQKPRLIESSEPIYVLEKNGGKTQIHPPVKSEKGELLEVENETTFLEVENGTSSIMDGLTRVISKISRMFV